ncbi:MAG: SDR family oxidoreductase [Acidobacteria bacterium]|nr:SDR family oxidoreductase [Acidobacteriota bacterium]MYK88027.1 SDR family oxidoreductase [Acidobacteriota bacterium]
MTVDTGPAAEERDARFAGSVAIVTGGSKGIGRAVAENLLQRGADVVISGRSVRSLDEAAAGLAALAGTAGAGRVETVAADVRRPADAERLIAAAADRFGGVDILVNNAGVGCFDSVAEQSVDDWAQVIETNLNGVFYCCRAAIPILRSRSGGWIINVSSLAGSHPFANGAAYCASKAGLDAFTAALMQEVRFDGIRVSAVAPGSVGTAFAGSDDRHAAAPWKLTASDVAQVVVDLLSHDARSLPSRVEIRPSQPRKG